VASFVINGIDLLRKEKLSRLPYTGVYEFNKLAPTLTTAADIGQDNDNRPYDVVLGCSSVKQTQLLS